MKELLILLSKVYFVSAVISAILFVGYYAPNDGMASCDDCLAGSYCDHYELNNITGVIVPVPCPEGYYCPLNTEYATQNACPNGTFSNNTMLDDISKCQIAIQHSFLLSPLWTPLYLS